MAHSLDLDPNPAFAIDEAPRLTQPLALDSLSEAIALLLRQNHELRQELMQSRSASSSALYETRALLLAVAERVDQAHNLARAVQRRASAEGMSDTWVGRIERFERAMASLATDAGLTPRRPAGQPQPGVDEVVEIVDGEGIPSGEIVEVVREGLLWRGEVLRRAEVTVAR
jgi:molecular chaperone GrpE (heat shock protein)